MSSENATTTINLTMCNGVAGSECRFALPVPAGLEKRIRTVVERSGWPAFLRAGAKGPIGRHNQFSIVVAACANGCSRPPIADFGLIRAHRPDVDRGLCTNCGACVAACPDDAVALAQSGGPVIDPARCLSCGRCAAACPEGALDAGMRGFRVLVGGCLGRHPQLGVELPGIMAESAALAVLDRCLRYWMANHRTGSRFGRVLFGRGVARGLAEVAG